MSRCSVDLQSGRSNFNSDWSVMVLTIDANSIFLQRRDRLVAWMNCAKHVHAESFFIGNSVHTTISISSFVWGCARTSKLLFIQFVPKSTPSTEHRMSVYAHLTTSAKLRLRQHKTQWRMCFYYYCFGAYIRTHIHTHALYRLVFKPKHNHGDQYTRTPSDVCVDWTVNFWSLLLHQTVSIVLTCSDCNLVVVIDFLCRFFAVLCVCVFRMFFPISVFRFYTLKKEEKYIRDSEWNEIEMQWYLFQTNLTSLN